MDNESGRGSRSNEPPKLAPVRRLHLDDGEGSSATATEEWYETERLTGQITGRARDTSTIDRPAPSQSEAPAVLDWRHAEATPPPTALGRLRRTLERRRRPQLAFRAPRRDSWVRRGGAAAVATTTGENVPPAALPPPDEAAVEARRDEAPRPPLLRLRHDPEQAEPRTARALRTKLRGHTRHFRWGRGASIGALTLAVAATATIGIASAISGSPAKPRRASLGVTTSAHAPGFGTAAKALTAALGFVEHHVRTGSSARPRVRARRPRQATRHHHRAARGRSPASASPAPAPSTSSNGSSSSPPAYSGFSAAPASSSQPATSESTPAASSSTTQRSQPAFGANGTLGPGRGAPGTQ